MNVETDRSVGNAKPRPLEKWEHGYGQLVAGLIDGELERRRPPTAEQWAAEQLGLPGSRPVVIENRLKSLEFRLAAHAVGDAIERHAPVAITDGEGRGGEPVWASTDRGDRPVPLPTSVLAAFPGGTVADLPLALLVRPAPTDGHWVGIIAASGRGPDADHALKALVRRFECSPANPYRGQIIALSENSRIDLDARIVAIPEDRRTDLVLPEPIWEEVDRNVTTVIEHGQLLRDLDLGMNRGVLLVGPPGTGKTQLTRVLTAELVGQATVLLPDGVVMRDHLPETYELADKLAPSLVILEDVDLVIGDRERGSSHALIEFLATLDGAMTRHTGVVTIATTNEADAIDDAAKRAARFDRIVEVPPPPLEGRRRIFDRYLAGLDREFDTVRLARITAGATGADIREIVRHAILATRGEATDEVLADLSRERCADLTNRHGNYL